MSADPDEEKGYDAENMVACESMNEDAQHHESFVPSHQDPTQQGVGSSSMNHDQCTWVQTELRDLRIEQSRQGIEQARKGVVFVDMNMMM